MAEIRFHDPNALAMTARCADFRAFMAGMKGPPDRNLLEHLKVCPTCRKVAAESIRDFLVEDGPLEPSKEIRQAAKSIVEKSETGEEEEIRSVTIVCADGSLRVDGLPHQIARGPVARVALEEKPYPFTITVEPVDDRFLLKIATAKPTDAVAILKAAPSGDVAPARKFASTLSWPGLAPDSYLLRVSGKEGSVAIRLRLARSA